MELRGNAKENKQNEQSSYLNTLQIPNVKMKTLKLLSNIEAN